MSKIKIAVIILLVLGGIMLSGVFTDIIEPVCQADIAISAVNGGDAEFIKQNIVQHNKDIIKNIGGCIFIIGIISMFFVLCPKTHEEKDEIKV